MFFVYFLYIFCISLILTTTMNKNKNYRVCERECLYVRWARGNFKIAR